MSLNPVNPWSTRNVIHDVSLTEVMIVQLSYVSSFEGYAGAKGCLHVLKVPPNIIEPICYKRQGNKFPSD
jgi:hypothetical protein